MLYAQISFCATYTHETAITTSDVNPLDQSWPRKLPGTIGKPGESPEHPDSELLSGSPCTEVHIALSAALQLLRQKKVQDEFCLTFVMCACRVVFCLLSSQ